ncbi:class I SAM-dependent methyltransferase [Nostoc ellipsosporum NOK]|nr:class I SAM-dependent methyltransferase [Nostoc ellipsosporum NOK]
MAAVLMASAALPHSPLASLRSVPIYDQSAKQMADLYEATTFEQVHAGVLDLLPPRGASILDVGSGSGRDAAALAASGYRVTAVEPSRGLREEAQRRHRDAAVEWLDDALPGLHALETRRFAFILVSAVWMHLVPHDRPIAMRRLVQLLEPGGCVVISIRQGAPDPTRAIVGVTASEVLSNAVADKLRLVRELEVADVLGRADVTWSTLALEKPLP